MAIKNTDLGGTDWSDGNVLEAVDLNDTFDAVSDRSKSLSTFWNNTDLYDVYDDFESYSTGTFTTNTKWTITIVGPAPDAEIIASTINTSGQELQIYSQGDPVGGPYVGSTTAITNILADNKHTFAKFSYNTGETGNNDPTAYAKIYAGNDTDGWTLIFSQVVGQDKPNKDGNGTVLVIALGSDEYDIYAGAILTNLTLTSGCQLKFYIYRNADNDWGGYLSIDDVRQAKTETE